MFVGAEGVLGGEAHLHPGGLFADEGDDLERLLDDPRHVAAVGGAQVPAGAEEQVDALDAGLERRFGGVLAGLDVGDDLRAEPQAGHRPGVAGRLGRGHRGGHLQVLDAEGVERFGDLHLVVGAEMRPLELLPFAQRGVDDGPLSFLLDHPVTSRPKKNRPASVCRPEAWRVLD